MMKMRRHRINEERKGQDSWLLTYSDVITLVLCMFIMLYSFSTIDAQKFQQLVTSLNQSFSGVLDGGKIIIQDPLDELPREDEPSEPGEDKEIQETYEKVVSLIEEYGLTDQVYVGIGIKGVEIRFSDSVFFDSGKADIKPGAMELLNKLSAIFLDIENEVLVEGHTDNIPMYSLQFPSNWELSAGRAISVVKHFIAQGVEPERLGALGFGEYRPIDTNSTAQGRQQNRRVNVIVMRENND